MAFGYSAISKKCAGTAIPYTTHFMVIRYEDLVLDTVNIARELYRFAEFEWPISVDEWIHGHAQSKAVDSRNPYSLNKNATAVLDKWKMLLKTS